MKISKNHKIFLFVMKYIQDLNDIEWIEAGLELTEDGKKEAAKLIKSGFRPSDEEFKGCVKEILDMQNNYTNLVEDKDGKDKSKKHNNK